MNIDRTLDDELLDSHDASSCVTTLDPETEAGEPTSGWVGPRCEKCEAPIKSDVVTICRQCGWYASLGQFVELDPNWETDIESAAPAPQAKSHIQVWLELMPAWSWVIIASALAVVAESVVVRLATPAESSLRTAWSLTQLSIGLVLAIGCHVFNFLVCAADDSDFGVLDILLKPVKLWARAVQSLPSRLWVANCAVCGVVAVVMSIVVIGGLPYERLWDWGFDAPVKQDLMGAVMDRAKQLDSQNGADNLEDAIGDFAGSQDVDAEDSKKTAPPKPRRKADCVILGYLTDRDGRLDTLLLGTAYRTNLIYAGRVTPKMSEEELQSLLQALQSVKSLTAFIPMDTKGNWVQPKFTCRITYGEQLRNGQFRDIQWDTLLGSIRTRQQ